MKPPCKYCYCQPSFFLIYFPHKSQEYYTTKGKNSQMTIAELKLIIEDLTDDTVILIEETDINEVETVNIQIHSDGRCHLILSALE